KAAAYDSNRGALPGDWSKDGWRADLTYHELSTPIPISKLGPPIATLNLVRGPINQGGTVNQGYLYEISDRAAALIGAAIPVEQWPNEWRAVLHKPLESTSARHAIRDPEANTALQGLLRRYLNEQIIFPSSAQQRRYAITAWDENGVNVERLDAN